MDTPEPCGYCPKRSNDDISRAAAVQDCGTGHLDTEKPRVVEWLLRRRTCWHGWRQSIERERENPENRTAAAAVGEWWHGTRISSSRCCRYIQRLRTSVKGNRTQSVGSRRYPHQPCLTLVVVRGLHCRASVRARACRPHPYRSGSALEPSKKIVTPTSPSRCFEICVFRCANPPSQKNRRYTIYTGFIVEKFERLD